MIGERYWSVGITVWQVRSATDEWHAEAAFCDDGFCDMDSSEGVLRCRYVGPLSKAIDVVKADAERLGIVWSDPRNSSTGRARIYYKGDGESSEAPRPPKDWKERVNAEARRIGWTEAYNFGMDERVSP